MQPAVARRVEPAAVVLHQHRHRARAVHHADLHPAGPRVGDDVDQGLLQHAEDLLGARGVERPAADGDEVGARPPDADSTQASSWRTASVSGRPASEPWFASASAA